MLELLVFKRLDEDARMRGFESCIRASNSTASAVRGPPEGLYAADLTKSLPIRIIWLAVCKTLAVFLLGKTSFYLEPRIKYDTRYYTRKTQTTS